MPVLEPIQAFHDEMTGWRRDFHRHPELAFAEHRTSALVQERLQAFGCDEVHAGLAGTGVVATIHGRLPLSAHSPNSHRAIALRADMDALPIEEQSGAAHSSQSPGVMHACGHDGHTTMLLGAARYLAQTRNFAGTVHLVFQPAEERGGGGGVMVRDGLFERFPVDQVFGLHAWPQLAAGRFGWRVGHAMAAVATIEITVTGRGAHGAHPEHGVDPVVVSAAIVSALQTIVSRSLAATDAGLVTIGSIGGGQAHNVIPESVRMLGTARWFTPAVGNALEAGVGRIATGIAAALGARAEVRFERTYPAVVNDPLATGLARDAARAVAGEAMVAEQENPTMGAEDFAFMAQARPGAYLMMGTGSGEPDQPLLHHPRYDFNDAMLPLGASYWATLAEQVLAP